MAAGNTDNQKKGSFTYQGRHYIIFTCSKILQFRLRNSFVFQFIFLVEKKVKGSSTCFLLKLLDCEDENLTHI